ncbi:response regulator receiver domain protein [Nautilia profundicola AmH]|uniref:Response regulator receiver domain protein n=1 Tax=Nautilia profundicola (strain ATCC BAA-1463 / DSM 18972 / AmH) TaxID=598659 RepID=B9L7R6_NAUPA|nr:response regulator transcription factor [Nautilia profundicola]ACM92192.1 response regulator receiver domain protein [Nautilia profundicola AmH]
MKILLIEDDEKIAKNIEKVFRQIGYRIDIAKDGEEGLYMAQNNNYDVLIVDWMLPKISGIDLLKKLKKEKNTPALILTAKSDIEDKVEGLNVADDYLTKPFEFEELIARVKALYRRSNNLNDNIIRVADLELNPETKEVRRAGKLIELTAKQFELLKYLMINKNKIVNTDMIQSNLWEMDDEINSNVINVYISHLRKKIDKDFDKKLIKTYRGMGFKLSDE